VAHTLEEGRHASDYGVRFGEPELDLKALAKWKDGVVKKHRRRERSCSRATRWS
jgi:pyruvate/2-oxoglutarate dehydrogenase complex dihydrolipoamide dehydrogenase (E3) component